MIRHFALVFAALLIVTMPLSQAQAEGITPNHVYQVTDTINAQLNAFHEADFSEPGQISLNLSERKPRHVLQKAQEVFIKVQTLRGMKGLTANEVAPIPVRDVTPADVKGAVDKILKDLAELNSVYGTDPAAEAALPSGKKPTDVYANLATISASIDGLGIPATVPNDVYRLAETVVGDLEKVAQQKGVGTSVTFPSGAAGKSPGDVYNEVHALLGKVKTLTESPGYSITGGVVPLNKETGSITPAYVMDALNNVLAEVGAIKQTVGATAPTEFAPPESGKTPSNVFDSIKHAEALVDALVTGPEPAAGTPE